MIDSEPMTPAPRTPATSSAAPRVEAHAPAPAASAHGHAPHADEHGDGFDPTDPAYAAAPARTSLVLGIGVLAVVGLGGLFTLGFVPRHERQERLVAEAEQAKHDAVVVSVAKPRRSDASNDLSLPGSVRALQDTWIYARTNGYLKRWLVDVGDHVAGGQLLAEVEVPELDQELDQAKAALNQLRARLELAKANVGLAQSTFKRYENAAPGGGITQQELDEKRASLEVARASAAAAQADVAAGEANVRRLEQLRSFSEVAAPFSGTVTARRVEVGTLVTAGNGQGQALFRIVQVNPARVFVSVPQVDAPGIKAGVKAEVTVREFPGRVFKGQVERTTQAIDDATRTLLAEVYLPNDDGVLLSGMYAQVKFHVAQARPTWIVPQSCLVVSGDGTQVIVVRDGKAHFEDVVIDTDYGREIGILSGIGASDQVVTNPGERIVEGVSVRVKEPEAAKDAPKAQPPAPEKAGPKPAEKPTAKE